MIKLIELKKLQCLNLDPKKSLLTQNFVGAEKREIVTNHNQNLECENFPIRENGLINPPVVTPDTYELIAGERRLKAMKLLCYSQIEVRPMSVKDAEHQLNLEISENETRKDFSKKERIDYARKLERIEKVKAQGRQSLLNGRNELRENFPKAEQGRTSDIVAQKLGIGSGKQYEKEKYIADNANPTLLSDWDKGDISTHAAYIQIITLTNNAKKYNI